MGSCVGLMDAYTCADCSDFVYRFVGVLGVFVDVYAKHNNK